jgi:hypothetical protein
VGLGPLPERAGRAAGNVCDVRDRLGQLTAELTSGGWAARAELLADQLSLIMEGTYASAQALSAAGPARHARTLAESLLDVS